MGAAEKVRLTCAMSGIPFNDVRVSFDQWPKLKPSTKFGQLPMMDVDGSSVAQSNAMLTYVGKLGGMCARSPAQAKGMLALKSELHPSRWMRR